MLIGPDCSVTSEPVAELAPNWNLVQVRSVAIAIATIVELCDVIVTLLLKLSIII